MPPVPVAAGSPSAKPPIGPYSPVARAGDWLVVSGQLGVAHGTLVSGVAAQLSQAIANLSALLADYGAGLTDVVKTTVFMVDMADFAVVNQAYVEGFGDHRPARSAVAVVGLPLGALVEVEAWAYRPR
jgi:2-iminobutanoate/2-iminopropanoate deaminase